MRITVQELYSIGEVFGEIINKEIPIKTAVQLRRFNSSVGEELKIYDPERIKLLENAGCVKENNKYDTEKLQKENPEAFNKLNEKFIEFYNQEIELKWDPIKIKDLGDITVKSATLILLEKFIKE